MFYTTYYGSEEVSIDAYQPNSTTIAPSAVTRELNLDLALDGSSAELIESVTITISGIASGWDCTNDTSYGDAASVTISITDLSSGSINETLNLLGIVLSEDQILTIEITYKDNYPSPSTIVTDLSDELSNFNSDKSTPLTISASITLPSESNFTGSIGDWVTSEKTVTLN